MEEITGLSQPKHVLFTGSAPEIPKEKAVTISGTLKAPAQYLSKKLSPEIKRVKHNDSGFVELPDALYSIGQSTVYVFGRDRKIDLRLNEKTDVTDIITGQLVKHEIWGQLSVNQDAKLTVGELRKIIKRVKFFFQDKQQHGDFLLELQNFTAKVETTMADRNKSGEFEQSKKAMLIGNIGTPEFKLEAPVFLGYDPKIVRVEVVADVSDGGVKFMLESQDLFELEEKLSEEYINDEIAAIEELTELNISVVRIN